MSHQNKTGSFALNAIEENRVVLEDLAQKIWENPEGPFREFEACKLTANVLKDAGFSVEIGAGGLSTAIRAIWGAGNPCIGLLGEYDALPGMNQKAVGHREAYIEGAYGHGCGHNLLAAATVGGAIGIKAEMEANALPGTIVFYGCPAEEVMTGKPFMARSGCFKELDAALAWHPGCINRVNATHTCGAYGVKFHYSGTVAHAALDPWDGRSALDAVQLLNTGVEYLREHVSADVRIHYVITEGGVAPNIVPDTASVWYFVRALTRESVETIYQRLRKVAEGAAMMTETKLNVEFLGGCYPTLGNHTLASVVDEALREIPQEPWRAEELALAEKLNPLSSGQWESVTKANHLPASTQLFTGVAPINTATSFASSDIGDVGHICPTVQFNTTTFCLGAPGHSWQVTACSGSSMGRRGMIYGAKAMAVAGVKIFENPEILQRAKEEFLRETEQKPYICPVPDEIPLP